MSKTDNQWIFLKNFAKLIRYIENIGYKATAGEMYRTNDQQILYYSGLTLEDGKLISAPKKSKAKYSKHQDRLAVDINIFKNNTLTYEFEDIKQIGNYWVSLHANNRWGGDFNKNGKKDGFLDTPHFEMNI